MRKKFAFARKKKRKWFSRHQDDFKYNRIYVLFTWFYYKKKNFWEKNCIIWFFFSWKIMNVVHMKRTRTRILVLSLVLSFSPSFFFSIVLVFKPSNMFVESKATMEIETKLTCYCFNFGNIIVNRDSYNINNSR